MKDGGPAFPVKSGMIFYIPKEHEEKVNAAIKEIKRDYNGLTMRQYYKAAALTGCLASPYFEMDGLENRVAKIADKMIKEDEDHEA